MVLFFYYVSIKNKFVNKIKYLSHNYFGWRKMIKKIISTIVLSTGLFVGEISKEKEFVYEYSVILNGNTMSDILNGYTYKEYLIDEYNDLINYLDASLHTDAVVNNIDRFAKEGSVAKYEDGKIVVYVGEAKGYSIHGELKKSTCDTSNIRVKFYFSKYFFNK